MQTRCPPSSRAAAQLALVGLGFANVYWINAARDGAIVKLAR